MGVNIPLVDGWRIRSDTNNIILCRTESDREVEVFFYSTIEGALESFIEKKIKRFDSTSIFGLLQAIKTLKTGLNKALHPLKIEVVSKKQEEGK